MTKRTVANRGRIPRRDGGWRQGVALVMIAAFLAVTAYGLCLAYGVI